MTETPAPLLELELTAVAGVAAAWAVMLAPVLEQAEGTVRTLGPQATAA